jgi:hypothetical protein
MKKQSIDCCTGIASGRVFCGPVGCPYRCEYAFVGDSVNLAARLMCKADVGKIITDRVTADSAARSVQFSEFGTLQLKGKSKKIPTFEVEHFKSNASDFTHQNEQNYLTVDGMFDNLASFLPASILDAIVKHAISSMEQGSTNALLKAPPAALSGTGMEDIGAFAINATQPNGKHYRPRMRQAVCVVMRYVLRSAPIFSSSLSRPSPHFRAPLPGTRPT